MKKLLFIFFTISFSALIFAAQEKAKISKKEMSEKFKSNVEQVEPLGDCVIKGITAVKKGGTPRCMEFSAYINYINSDIDFVALNKSIDKSCGGSKGFLLKDFIAGVNKYISRENMNLQTIKISGTNPINKLKDGIPIFCWLAVSKLYNTDFLDRTKERASAKNAAEWDKTLKKLEKRNFRQKGHTYASAIICGFNKTTSEYLVLGVADSPIWLTEREIGELISDAYVLRF